MVSPEDWMRVRRGLRFGQRLRGTVTAVPRPGAIGVFMDLGLAVDGYVDVSLLPRDPARWPVEGTACDVEVWWADDRPRIALKPVDRRFLRDDFTAWQRATRPDWPERVPVERAWVDAAAARRRTGVVERTLRAAGWAPGRNVPTGGWRAALEASGLVRMHRAARGFLAEFGGLRVRVDGPGITCARTPFHFDPGLLTGEEDRFADWSAALGRAVFPIGELDEGRFFLGIDERGEVYLLETWVARFGPVRDALEKLVLGIAPERVDVGPAY
ncbi:SUKH-3 domain-containing protein [Streptomyces sp. NPDC048290]|uniref:SUKH-3 domain-containing protein n=1 Tax=Streptomyces sp. NPDC048290 TaxID=3155811 RepID=UPI0034354551